MNNVKTSREETQEERMNRLEMLVTESKLTRKYSIKELRTLRGIFNSEMTKAEEILLDVYHDYLLLIGMDNEEAIDYVSQINYLEELAEKLSKVDYMFLQQLRNQRASKKVLYEFCS